jgi:hypothetical protein
MSPSSFSKGAIPDNLINAKADAVKRFLGAPAPPSGAAAFAAVSTPDVNVVGVGIGRKLVGGKPTQGHCVRFYVAHKLPKNVIPPKNMLPTRIGGVATDVVESGRFKAFPASIATLRSRQRPARPGCSIGFQYTGAMAGYIMAGTFGAVVQKGGKTFILSNNHVLADVNKKAKGAPIFQQGLLDGGHVPADQIAKLTKFIKLNAKGANKVDCAIAEVLNPKTVNAAPYASVGRLKSTAPKAAASGMKVEKVGRTTGYTKGVVHDVAADVQVDYDGVVLTFQNQIVIFGTGKPFSDSGDSGSLIVESSSKSAVALLFGGSKTYTLANHFDEVLSALGVTLAI